MAIMNNTPMDTRTHMITPTEGTLAPASLLQLIWLASPALPIGGFSYSEGLEAAVDKGLVSNEEQAIDWLLDQLHLSQSRADLSVLAQCIGAWRNQDLARVRELNDWILQTRETHELRAQTVQMGRSLLIWLQNHHTVSTEQLAQCAALEPSFPVAFALAAGGTQAGVRECVLTCAFGWAENMVQSAIKSVPLGQSAGQRILARLADEIPAAVEHAISLRDNQRQAFSPMLAIFSSQHETQYSRLFRS
jgi:urease accessory protein